MDKLKGLALTNSLIESGEYLKHCEASIRKHVKRYLISQLGNICEICSLETWNGQPIPLVCDHIDGDSLNNKLENFRNICPNCDALLPTFKSKNRGKGRKYDRDYMNKRNNGE